MLNLSINPPFACQFEECKHFVQYSIEFFYLMKSNKKLTSITLYYK